MDILRAARAWARGWAEAWRTHDDALVGSLYAEDAIFRSHPHREPHRGAEGASAYARWAFEDELEVRCWFAEPYLVGGDRAAVEYWAVSSYRDGRTQTISGVTLLRFGQDGRVTEHRDYWHESDGALEPYEGWGDELSPGSGDAVLG